MSLFTKLVNKSIYNFFSRRKKWIIGMSIFMLLLFSIYHLFSYFINDKLSAEIKSFVHEKSNDFYTVEFDRIVYDITHGHFFVKDFIFKIQRDPDDSIDYTNLNRGYIYEASVKQLNIDILSIWSFFFTKKLKISGIEIVQPRINITNLDKNKSEKKISFEVGNLYQVLSGHLNELEINDFGIYDGEVHFITLDGLDYNNYHIKSIDFTVSNFQVNENSSKRTDKFFYTDDISLTIRDQVLLLKDSIHKVTFKDFHISTLENEIKITGFRLTKREDMLLDPTLHNHYDMFVPNIKLAGIDFVKAYNENMLLLDSIHVDQPTFYLTKRIQNPSKNQGKNELLDIAMFYYDYLKISHFNLNDAHLEYADSSKAIASKFSIDHVSASVHQLEIDTSIISNKKYGIDFSDMELNVKDYKVNLPDSINTISLDEFSVHSNPLMLKLHGLSLTPRATASMDEKVTKIMANVPYVVITGFDLAKVINQDSFDIKEIYIEDADITISPKSNTTHEQQKISAAGLFGISDKIKTNFPYFSLQSLNMQNAHLSVEKPQKSMDPIFDFNKVNFRLSNLEIDSLTDTKSSIFGKSSLHIDASNSHLQLSQHEVDLAGLEFSTDDGRLEIKGIDIKNDSTTADSQMRIKLSELLMSGIDLNALNFHEQISMDSIRFSSPEIYINNTATSVDTAGLQMPVLPKININHLVGQHANINLFNHGLPLFQANNINFNVSKFSINPDLSSEFVNQFDYDHIKYFSLSDYNFYLYKQKHMIHAAGISWSHPKDILLLNNIELIPTGKPNNLYKIHVPSIEISGVDLKRILKESYYVGNKVLIEKPSINLTLAKGRQEKLTNLDLGFIPILMRNNFIGFATKKFTINDGIIHVQQKTETDSLLFELDNFRLEVDDFLVDSTTEMLPSRFLFANDIRLHADYLSTYMQTNGDFYNINHMHISTFERQIRLNGIYYSNNTKNIVNDQNKTRLTVNDLFFNDFNFHSLTQNQSLDIGEIIINDADFNTISSDKDTLKTKQKTNEYPFDTLLLKDINIERVLLTNAKVAMGHAYMTNKNFTIPKLWLLADGVKYNPLAASDTSRIFYSDNLQAKVQNLSFDLPKSLSSIKIDELELNSSDSSVRASNFALVPMVGKFDFGNTKGYQSSWLNIENNSLEIKKIDFLKIINSNTLDANKIVVNKLDMSVFRDKRVPFPEWQRRPLPQTTLRELDFTINIDTIDLHDGFISYQEFAEKALYTGEVYFSDLNAKVVNITNDPATISKFPHMNISAKTNIFGKGKVHAEFQFDLKDPENIHTYGIKVDSFDLMEFNRIMIPSASVKITSGHSTQIIMSAKANNEYSHGEMKFLYEDLKISLLNRESETPKGLGNILGSFFANTFIIKSNNPKNFIVRKGDVFYERDEKRAIFNYWSKTFLSGVVSSIGAVNNKKKMRKMEEEDSQKLIQKNSTNPSQENQNDIQE